MRNFFFCAAGALGVVVVAISIWIWSYVSTTSPGKGTVLVEVPKGSGVRTIGSLLAEKQLVRNDLRFLLLARFSGIGNRLKAGEYEIAYGLTPLEVLQVLESGKIYYHSVTVPEGLTLVQVADIFERGGWINRDRFLALANDSLFAESLGVRRKNLEGYLFPDTYFLARGAKDEKAIIKTMVKRFFEVMDTLPLENQERLDQHQLLTLASIIEKETGAAEERPLIARVFLNRLARNMRLQSDPTVIYGIIDFNGNITKTDLRTLTPYNTYMIKGLPPGPICNPGRESIKAVLEPAESDALFFVSKNDGTHIFSKTLREHSRAVRKYQKKAKRENK
ncbi:endolytic transglycosylase MltG [Desulfogranum marinum]|uniref:endolytic transglycosylase MltG n=1 Tax=Desulfogranum marinum TaxID=453220 RepID=UPI0019654A8E|nr:endolytic transglycosylase MltG [Desulfogranum marinum]MBM9511293.1 endolytic transglycosylase MltG [Desulfogranum marinum]